MGLDRGMELSTLGKHSSVTYSRSQANTFFVISRRRSFWEVIYETSEMVFYHKYLICFLLCLFCRLTILPPIEALKPLFERFKVFHQDFMRKYRDPSSTL